MKTLFVVSSGLSTPSTTRQVADSISSAVVSAVGGRGEQIEATTIELREYAVDLTQTMTTGMPTPRLEEVMEKLSAADGLVVVTPVFKASYSGLFKMFFDVLDTDALNGMPTIIAATAGTPRHSLVTEFAMRPLLTYMRAVIVPTSIFAATEDFGGEEGDAIASRISRAAAELATLIVQTDTSVGGLAGDVSSGRRRSSGVNIDDKNLVPFSDLLQGHDGK